MSVTNTHITDFVLRADPSHKNLFYPYQFGRLTGLYSILEMNPRGFIQIMKYRFLGIKYMGELAPEFVTWSNPT